MSAFDRSFAIQFIFVVDLYTSTLPDDAAVLVE